MDREKMIEAALAEYSRLKSGDKFWNSLSDTWKQTSMSANRAEFERALAALEAAGWAAVSAEMLKQLYGMAQEGCSAPAAAYRWCERIDEVFHAGAALPEYEAYAQDLPAMLAADAK